MVILPVGNKPRGTVYLSDLSDGIIANLCRDAKSGSRSAVDTLIEKMKKGFQKGHQFDDKSVQTAICRIQENEKYQDMFELTIQALTLGYSLKAETLQYCFCRLRDSQMYNQAFELLDACAQKGIIFQNNPVKHTLVMLREQGKSEEAGRFIEICERYKYDINGKPQGDLGSIRSVKARVSNQMSTEERGSFIRKKLFDMSDIGHKIKNQIKILIEENPDEAFKLVEELINSEQYKYLNIPKFVGKAVEKFIQQNHPQKAAQIVLTAFYKGIEIDKNIVLQTISALSQGDPQITELSKFAVAC